MLKRSCCFAIQLPIWTLLTSLCALQICRAEDDFYVESVKPLLHEKCAACHGAIKQESGLRVDFGKGIHKGGDSGPIVNLEAVGESELLVRVRSEESGFRMPPEGEGSSLNDEELQLLEQWIESGAEYPLEEQPPEGPDSHWAYQPIVRPAIPAANVASRSGSMNPIDAFVLSRLHAEGLVPMPQATPSVRLRRLYLDLIGLPPLPDQLAAFQEDSSSEHWARIVDDLLEQNAHGERWARHWMDVWRYSDWDGFKNNVRGSQRHIWRWRDWIIESLNADTGYDQMLTEMLAGDELAPEDPKVLRATGFLARNFHHSNRNIWLDATVEHTSKAFMATTLNCARCHDHKYDPISQNAFYGFRAIFEPHKVRTERVPGQADTVKDGLVRAYDADLAKPTYLYIGGNEKQPDKSCLVQPGVPGVLGGQYQANRLALPAVAKLPVLRGFVEKEDLKNQRVKVENAAEKLSGLRASENSGEYEIRIAEQQLSYSKAELASLEARWEADKQRYQANGSWHKLARRAEFAEQKATQAQAQLNVTLKESEITELKSQLNEKSGEELQAKIAGAEKSLAQLKNRLRATFKKPVDRPPRPAKYTPVGTRYPDESTGRRLALARWLTAPANPLTARVAVNYIWMHHFGEPLVPSVDDFGMRCPKPHYAELLDWLAAELAENNWSMKHIHRLIVNSSVYQLTSSPSALTRQQWQANSQKDPDNQLLWHGKVQRMDSESIRDSLLYLANSLEYSIGGPELDYMLGESNYRRSIYFRTAYEKQMTMMVVFDGASPNECYRRSPSVIPQQALALANSSLAIDQSRLIAAKIMRELGEPSNAYRSVKHEDFVERAFCTLLTRIPTRQELEVCNEFLVDQEELLRKQADLKLVESTNEGKTKPAEEPRQRARENLIHAIVNHNDFVTIR